MLLRLHHPHTASKTAKLTCIDTKLLTCTRQSESDDINDGDELQADTFKLQARIFGLNKQSIRLFPAGHAYLTGMMQEPVCMYNATGMYIATLLYTCCIVHCIHSCRWSYLLTSLLQLQSAVRRPRCMKPTLTEHPLTYVLLISAAKQATESPTS